jgi:hypothetical protein
MVDITTIPEDELKKDLEDSRADIATCEMALVVGVVRFKDMLVADRLRDNQYFVEVILKELNRRTKE